MDRWPHTLRQHPWAWGIGLGLALAVLVTALIRTYAVRAVEADAEARQEAVVEAALATIDDRFRSLRRELHGRARGVAADSSVAEGLQTWREREERSPTLTQHVVGLKTGSHTTVEVYPPDGPALAWTGTRMPLDSTRIGTDLPTKPRTTVVEDGNGRSALAAWVPVKREGEVLGAVRVVRVVRYRPPVQNRHMEARSLEDRWRQQTDELVRVRWTSSPPRTPHRALRGVDGAILGYGSVDPPSPDRLVERTASFYTDLLV
ncbi:MAG: histidine kinase, partial [Bacteroidetes bacterium QH_2_63_10]